MTTGNILKKFRYGSLDLLCVHTEAYYVGGVAEGRGLLARISTSFFHPSHCRRPTVCDDNIDPAHSLVCIHIIHT